MPGSRPRRTRPAPPVAGCQEFSLYRLPARIVISALSVSRSRVRSLFHRPPHRGHRTTSRYRLSITPNGTACPGGDRRRTAAVQGRSRPRSPPHGLRVPTTSAFRAHDTPGDMWSRPPRWGAAHTVTAGTRTHQPRGATRTTLTPRPKDPTRLTRLTRRLVGESSAMMPR